MKVTSAHIVVMTSIVATVMVGVLVYSLQDSQTTLTHAQAADEYQQCISSGGTVSDSQSCPSGSSLGTSGSDGGLPGSTPGTTYVCCRVPTPTPTDTPKICPSGTVQVPASQCQIPVEPVVAPAFPDAAGGFEGQEILQPGNVCCPSTSGPTPTPSVCVDTESTLEVTQVSVSCPACTQQ